jgi:hypothetical protein
VHPEVKVVMTAHTGFRKGPNPHLEHQIKSAYGGVVSVP